MSALHDPLWPLRAILTTASPLAAYQDSPARRQVDGDLVLMEVGPGGARRRHVIVLGEVVPEEFFARAAVHYGDARVDSVELVVERAGAVEAALRERGWKLDEEEPALVLEGAPDPVPAPAAGLTVRRAMDQATLDDFYSIYKGANRHVPSVEAARDPRVAALVGYVDGLAVASSRLSAHGDVADIMGVVTRPEYRRHGYGTAMTWAAVGAAREAGCSTFLLTASEMGYPVYVKMGFVPICTMRTYAAPAVTH